MVSRNRPRFVTSWYVNLRDLQILAPRTFDLRDAGIVIWIESSGGTSRPSFLAAEMCESTAPVPAAISAAISRSSRVGGLQPRRKTPLCTRFHSRVARRPLSHFQETSAASKSARLTKPNCLEATATSRRAPAPVISTMPRSCQKCANQQIVSIFGPARRVTIHNPGETDRHAGERWGRRARAQSGSPDSSSAAETRREVQPCQPR